MFPLIMTKSKQENILFGSHLTIDGYGGDPTKLNDHDLVYRCLDELPSKIGMKKLAP